MTISAKPWNQKSPAKPSLLDRRNTAEGCNSPQFLQSNPAGQWTTPQHTSCSLKPAWTHVHWAGTRQSSRGAGQHYLPLGRKGKWARQITHQCRNSTWELPFELKCVWKWLCVHRALCNNPTRAWICVAVLVFFQNLVRRRAELIL